MSQVSKKEAGVAAVVGMVIGSIAGLMISLAMVKEHRKCEALKREHQMMQEMLIYYQNQPK